MATAVRARRKRGRGATLPWLRVLGALVALLLTASALSQTAHFLLIPHAICAEHGELLELGERAGHAEAQHLGEAAAEPRAAASQPEIGLEHDHCELLARAQREQATAESQTSELLPAAASALAIIATDDGEPREQTPPLTAAPKTSPPLTTIG